MEKTGVQKSRETVPLNNSSAFWESTKIGLHLNFFQSKTPEYYDFSVYLLYLRGVKIPECIHQHGMVLEMFQSMPQLLKGTTI
jgi:hypothetical protein